MPNDGRLLKPSVDFEIEIELLDDLLVDECFFSKADSKLIFSKTS